MTVLEFRPMLEAWGFHPWTAAAGCSSGPCSGTVSIEQAALAVWRTHGLSSFGIFNCRKVGGSDDWSLHAEGRAVDLAVGGGGLALGDRVLFRLMGAASALGLQRIIWNRFTYDRESPAGRPYHGRNPHTDHLHVEQAVEPAHVLTLSDALLALDEDQEDENMPRPLIVRYGGVWMVAADLSGRTAIASTADQLALQATGQYVVVALTAAQMLKIPVSSSTAGGHL